MKYIFETKNEIQYSIWEDFASAIESDIINPIYNELLWSVRDCSEFDENEYLRKIDTQLLIDEIDRRKEETEIARQRKIDEIHKRQTELQEELKKLNEEAENGESDDGDFD